MNRYSIVARLGPSDTAEINTRGKVSELQFIKGKHRLGYGIGHMLTGLLKCGVYPSETAIDLTILAAVVTAADTRIPRDDAQDSWTREISLFVPVAKPDLWLDQVYLIERILQFLTGDIWRVTFRPRHQRIHLLPDYDDKPADAVFETISLFSGGLDSFVGAIDLLDTERSPIFVSYYRDASTKDQSICASKLGDVYGDITPRHVRANVSFKMGDMPGLPGETSMRGRSFIFFALACLAADGLDNMTEVYVPENGFISLNVPLNPLRIGALSTRTTHPFYMARWQELINNLGIRAHLKNPYRFMTKGEMLKDCRNQELLKESLDLTMSCSSPVKGRWQGLGFGHCGYCVPCLIRRASVKKAFDDDPTEYHIHDLAKYTFDAEKAESEGIRAFQMMSQRLRKNPQLIKTLVHKPGPLDDYSTEDIGNYVDVFLRGMKEVDRVIRNVEIKS